MEAAGQLPREIPPGNDLWPGIRDVIIGTRMTGRDEHPNAKAVAWRMAAAVALVAFSSLTTLWVTRVTTPEALGPEVLGARIDPINYNHPLGTQYDEQRRLLELTYRENLAKLSPETRIAVEKNLLELRDSVDEINKLLAEHPDNTLLKHMQLAAYQSELEIYENVNRMTRIDLLRNEI